MAAPSWVWAAAPLLFIPGGAWASGLDAAEPNWALMVVAVGVGMTALIAVFVRPVWSLPLLIIFSVIDEYPWMHLPFLPDLTLTKVVMAVAISGWIFAMLCKGGIRIEFPKFIWFYWAFAVSGLISSLAHARDPAASFKDLFGIFTLPVVFVFMANVLNSHRQVRRLANLFLFTSAGLGAWALLEYLTQSGTLIPVEVGGIAALRLRPTATLSNPNEMALVLLLAAPLAMKRLFQETSRPVARLINLTACLCVIGGIIVSRSRAAMVVFLVTLVFVYVWGTRRERKRVAVAALLFVAVTLSVPSTRARMSTLVGSMPRLQVDISAARYSVSKRKEALAASMRIFSRYPILGCGAGNFPAYSRDHSEGMRFLSSAENTYVAVLAETGLLGAIWYLLFLASLLFYFRHSLKLLTEPGVRSLAVGLMGGYLTVMVFNVFGKNLDDNLPWVLLGLFVALVSIEAKKAVDTEHRVSCPPTDRDTTQPAGPPDSQEHPPDSSPSTRESPAA